MATQTIERNTESTGTNLSTLVTQAQSQDSPMYQEPFSLVAALEVVEKESTPTMETAAFAPVPIHRDGFLVKMARQAVAL